MKSIYGATSFDTNAQWIVIDNRCLGCISHVKSSFIGRMQPTTQLIKDSQDREWSKFGTEHSTGIGKMTMVPRTHSSSQTARGKGGVHPIHIIGHNRKQRIHMDVKAVANAQRTSNAFYTGETTMQGGSKWEKTTLLHSGWHRD